MYIALANNIRCNLWQIWNEQEKLRTIPLSSIDFDGCILPPVCSSAVGITKKKSDFDRKLIDTNNCAPFDGRELVCWAWSFVGQNLRNNRKPLFEMMAKSNGILSMDERDKAAEREKERENNAITRAKLFYKNCTNKTWALVRLANGEKSMWRPGFLFIPFIHPFFSEQRAEKVFKSIWCCCNFRFYLFACIYWENGLRFMCFGATAGAGAGIGIRMKCKKKSLTKIQVERLTQVEIH